MSSTALRFLGFALLGLARLLSPHQMRGVIVANDLEGLFVNVSILGSLRSTDACALPTLHHQLSGRCQTHPDIAADPHLYAINVRSYPPSR
jgi:hypothetical protein